LNKGATIDSLHSKYFLSPLVYAVKTRSLEIVRLLLKNRADVNMQCYGGVSALHTACDWIDPPNDENIELVKLLLEEADIDLMDDRSYTPLYLAVKREHSQLVKLLLEESANADINCGKSGTALQAAVESGNFKAVRLLANRPEIDINFSLPWKGTALELALEHGHLRAVKLLHRRGASINPTENSCPPLTLAARNGHIEVVKYLLENEAIVDAYDGDSTAIDTALSNGRNDIAELLVEHGAKLDAKHMGETPLQRASRQGKHTAVEFLLKHGANINAGHKACRSSLELAVKGGHVEVVNALFKQ
ncbi:ankyrin repeat-containing domain protein, partial [Bipolaris maydis]